MNSIRAQLMGELEVRKQKRVGLTLAGRSHVEAMEVKLARSSFIPIEEIDASAISYHAGELLHIQNELKQVNEEIVKIQKELE